MKSEHGDSFTLVLHPSQPGQGCGILHKPLPLDQLFLDVSSPDFGLFTQKHVAFLESIPVRLKEVPCGPSMM